jgi:hypothetical protein
MPKSFWIWYFRILKMVINNDESQEVYSHGVEFVSLETARDSLLEVESKDTIAQLYAELRGKTHVLKRGGVPEEFRKWLLGGIYKGFGLSSRQEVYDSPDELAGLLQQFKKNRLQHLMELNAAGFTARNMNPMHRVVNCGIGSNLRYHRDYQGEARSPSVEVWNLLGRANYIIGFSPDEREAERFVLGAGDRLVFNGGDVDGVQPYHGVYIPTGQETHRIVLLITNSAPELIKYAIN